MQTGAQPRRLGVGLCYQKELHDFLVGNLGAVDFLEIVPETAWTDHGSGQVPQYVDETDSLRFFQELRSSMPIVSHSIGLSIASAHRFRHEHLQQIRRWAELLSFPWHSDHLAFNLVLDAEGREYLLGVPFPVVFDDETLDVLTDRVHAVMEAIAAPFLLENNVTYIRYPEQRYDEPVFLNELCRRSGCGVLLDLHNLYVDWRNHGADIDSFVDRLDLDNVVELHLAGGLTYQGTYLDAHSGAPPPELLRLAGELAIRCRNLRGITFELLGSWYPRMGSGALLETLAACREIARRGVAPSAEEPVG